MSTDPASVHRRFVDEVAIGKRVDLLEELFDPDAVLDQGSLDALRAQMESQAAGLDGAVQYLHEIVEGEWVVHHMLITLTHTGEFMGVAASGRSATVLEVEAARVVGGRIVEMWAVADATKAMHELGIP